MYTLTFYKFIFTERNCLFCLIMKRYGHISCFQYWALLSNDILPFKKVLNIFVPILTNILPELTAQARHEEPPMHSQHEYQDQDGHCNQHSKAGETCVQKCTILWQPFWYFSSNINLRVFSWNTHDYNSQKPLHLKHFAWILWTTLGLFPFFQEIKVLHFCVVKGRVKKTDWKVFCVWYFG